MTTSRRRSEVSWVLLGMLLCGPLVAGAASGGSTLDEGKLEVGWFAAGATFNEDDEIDYLWVKDGFDLAGQSLQFAPWGDPKFPGQEGRRARRERSASRGDDEQRHADAVR